MALHGSSDQNYRAARTLGSGRNQWCQSNVLAFEAGRALTVPVVELVRGEPKSTAILLADAGRNNTLEQADRLLALGNRVLAVDPFYYGESKIKSRAHLLPCWSLPWVNARWEFK